MPARLFSFDVTTSALTDFLDIFGRAIPFTYIVVALGDDERNIQIAAQLKRYYRRQLWENPQFHQPEICVNIEDEIKSSYAVKLFESMDTAPPEKRKDYRHHVFGTNRQTFSQEVLIQKSAWIAARKLHIMLKGKKTSDAAFWSEYDRCSSLACACHASYHVASAADQRTWKISEEQYKQVFHGRREAFIDAEHRRWMHYVRSEGMQYADPETVAAYRTFTRHHVDVIGKLTPCLVPTNMLDDLYNSLYPPETSGHSFKQNDELVAQNAWRLCRIVEDERYDLELEPLQSSS